MSPLRTRPVGPLAAAIGALVAALVLFAVASLAEALRPQWEGDAEELSEAPDPRHPVRCAAQAPREGEPRDEESTGGGLTVVSTRELRECSHVFDGRLVRVSGEVVGPLLRRPHGVWAQLNDGPYAVGAVPGDLGPNQSIGLFLRNGAADAVRTGAGRHRGDRLDVVGTFHRVDPSLGESAVVRAHQVVLAEPGGPSPAPPRPGLPLVAGAFAALALVLVAIALYRSSARWR
jgi:hypothetical protein